MIISVAIADSWVTVDGVGYQIALPRHDPNIRAMQWYGSFGKIEKVSGPQSHTTSFEQWRPFLDAWTLAATPIVRVIPRRKSEGVPVA